MRAVPSIRLLSHWKFGRQMAQRSQCAARKCQTAREAIFPSCRSYLIQATIAVSSRTVRSHESEASLMRWRIAVCVDRRDFPGVHGQGNLGCGSIHAAEVRLNSRRKARKPVMPMPRRAIEVGLELRTRAQLS